MSKIGLLIFAHLAINLGYKILKSVLKKKFLGNKIPL
jgi:hypothetical protein